MGKRKAIRFQFEKLVSKVESSMENSETPRAKILASKSSLAQVHFNLNNINEEILNLLNEDEVKKETLESMKGFEPYHLVVAELVSSLENSDVISSRSRSHLLLNYQNSCKLPKLEIPKFSGNSMDWLGFRGQVQTPVHSSDGLSDIDCFNYLAKYLLGSAAACVSSLTLSSQIYKEAISIHQERFGNPQVLILACKDSLLKLKKSGEIG